MVDSRGKARTAHCGAAECQRAWQRDRMREYMRARRAARGRDLYAMRECASCGKPFQPTGRDVTRCCSRECTNVMRYGGEAAQPKLGRHSISKAKRLRIYERDGWTCYLCGYPVNPDAKAPALDAPTLDHVVPVRSGGDDSSDNLRTAHFYCNCVKGAKPLQAVA